MVRHIPFYLDYQSANAINMSPFFGLKCFRKNKIMSVLLNIIIAVSEPYRVPDGSPDLYVLT